MTNHDGGCLCGQVRFRVTTPSLDAEGPDWTAPDSDLDGTIIRIGRATIPIWTSDYRDKDKDEVDFVVVPSSPGGLQPRTGAAW